MGMAIRKREVLEYLLGRCPEDEVYLQSLAALPLLSDLYSERDLETCMHWLPGPSGSLAGAPEVRPFDAPFVICTAVATVRIMEERHYDAGTSESGKEYREESTPFFRYQVVIDIPDDPLLATSSEQRLLIEGHSGGRPGTLRNRQCLVSAFDDLHSKRRSEVTFVARWAAGGCLPVLTLWALQGEDGLPCQPPGCDELAGAKRDARTTKGEYAVLIRRDEAAPSHSSVWTLASGLSSSPLEWLYPEVLALREGVEEVLLFSISGCGDGRASVSSAGQVPSALTVFVPQLTLEKDSEFPFGELPEWLAGSIRHHASSYLKAHPSFLSQPGSGPELESKQPRFILPIRGFQAPSRVPPKALCTLQSSRCRSHHLPPARTPGPELQIPVQLVRCSVRRPFAEDVLIIRWRGTKRKLRGIVAVDPMCRAIDFLYVMDIDVSVPKEHVTVLDGEAVPRTDTIVGDEQQFLARDVTVVPLADLLRVEKTGLSTSGDEGTPLWGPVLVRVLEVLKSERELRGRV
ncbi:MAG TPA: hypothetical protein GX510_03555 [Firmicutes bacterium]|nr:hypothetical protein [Candidatus Fermentithermobacillaceae bacterium]